MPIGYDPYQKGFQPAGAFEDITRGAVNLLLMLAGMGQGPLAGMMNPAQRTTKTDYAPQQLPSPGPNVPVPPSGFPMQNVPPMQGQQAGGQRLDPQMLFMLMQMMGR